MKPLLILLALASAAPAWAQALVGTWGAGSCAALARRLVFTPATMELTEGGRRLFVGRVSYASAENVTTVTVAAVDGGAGQPGQPLAGDAIVFRREREHLFLERHLRAGRVIAAPEGAPPLMRCP